MNEYNPSDYWMATSANGTKRVRANTAREATTKFLKEFRHRSFNIAHDINGTFHARTNVREGAITTSGYHFFYSRAEANVFIAAEHERQVHAAIDDKLAASRAVDSGKTQQQLEADVTDLTG